MIRRHLDFAACSVLAAASLNLYTTKCDAQESKEASTKATAVADEGTANEDATEDTTKTPEDLIKKINSLEQELARRGVANPRGELGRTAEIAFLLETPFLGPTYYNSSNGMRFIAIRLNAVNLKEKEIVIAQSDVALTVDGQQFPLQDVPAGMSGQGFSVGNQNYSLSNVKQLKNLKVPAGQTADAWIVFTGIAAGNHVPSMQLGVKIDGVNHQLNVNEFARAELMLSEQRIGPRDSLALLTIGGPLNTVNFGSLIDKLDELTSQQIVRVVIRWAKGAPPVEANLLNWVERSAVMWGRTQNNNSQYAQFPNSIREFHVTKQARNGSVSYSSNNLGKPRLHDNETAAVAAALKTAYEVIPLDELLVQIQEGGLLTRAAALSAGGDRLTSDHLPLILKYIDEPAMRDAALTALRHFGDEEALNVLVQTAQKKNQEESRLAVESLAASRYSAAHFALLELLRTGQIASKKTIVSVLAEYPRPLWQEAVFKLAEDSNSAVRVEALQALARMGHERVHELLADALESQDNNVRDASFRILVNKTDAASEKLALDYALELLEKTPPTSEIVQLISRTKDERAVPLLLKHLANEKAGNRSTIINALGQLADDSITTTLVELYPKLKGYEQVSVLNVLSQFRAPEFVPLAELALATEDSSLVSSACRGLQMEATPSAIRLLANSLKTAKKTQTWSYVCNALSYVGTKEARAALKQASESKEADKQRYAANALRNLRQRSPAYQHVYQGQHYAKQKDWKTAFDHYSLAIGIDSEMVEAYIGRGNAQIELKSLDEARKDFEKAKSLDDANSAATTGLAVVRVLQGDVHEGIQLVEKVRDKFEKDALFSYNSACVYSRALENAKKEKNETDAELEARRTSYREKALVGLRNSVKFGFKDFDWMRKDPDLKPLHELEEFKKIAK